MTKLEIEKVRTKARRANARLRALENAGYQSNAYEMVRTIFRKNEIPEEGDLVQGTGYVADPIRFRTDISTLARTDEEAFKTLETELNIFLNAEDSTVQQIKRNETLRQKRYEQAIQDLTKTHGTEERARLFLEHVEAINEESHNAAFDTFNKNREARGLHAITREQYDFLFNNAYTDYLSKRFSSSDQWVDVAIAAIEEDTDVDLTIRYLNRLGENEEAVLAHLMRYASKGTPDENFEYNPLGFNL